MSRAVIFINGNIADYPAVRQMIQPGDTLLAADGGTCHLLELGLIPSLVIGDLDSINEEQLRKLETVGTEILRHPIDKNETDFELVLNYAVDAGYTRILVVAALGGRLDHTLGNLALLTNPRLASLDIRLDDGGEEIFFSRSRCQIRGAAHDIISLIPWGGDVTGVATKGLRWELKGEILEGVRTRGISNELLGEAASISLKTGLLLIIHSRFRVSE